jgi:uncharacterized protein YndB with AHSA1/START domain
MKKLSFSTTIAAPARKVWNILWNDETYRQWTSVFSEGSHAVTDWQEGGKVQFLGPDGGGMYSVIDRKVPDEKMVFRHLGIVRDGIEQPLDELTKQWTGAIEGYTLTPHGDTTELLVELDVVEDHEQMFSEKFPIALRKVKELAEKG